MPTCRSPPDSAWPTWELHDALDSVRLHLDNTGAALASHSYSPFGVPQSSAMPDPFGFTGELHHLRLVYLLACWR